MITLAEDICQACAALREKVAELKEANAKLTKALQREADSHLDLRAPNTDKPTRERLTGGLPAGRSEL